MIYCRIKIFSFSKILKIEKRRWQDSNLRGETPIDFESITLTARSHLRCILKYFQIFITIHKFYER